MFHSVRKGAVPGSLKVLLSAMACWLPLATALAEDVGQYVSKSCAGCHALTQAEIKNADVSERARRKGPPLYYAGDKFKQKWLERWLAKPVRLRPAGSFPPDHTIVTDDGDVIDRATLKDHLALPAGKTKLVAGYLMGLHMGDKPLLNSQYKPKKISKMLGSMDFNKFKGCSACHRDAADNGGVSGPELYTAWSRMQPEFLISYIKDPVAWDVHTMMPDKHLKEKEIHKLVDYLKLIGEAAQ